ncbi:hypothetical protein Clacol_008258 [Clathrus columnatus]|uniref:SRP9 domain-containing protein n=1 Tax=Clathrus columnatus TaxID=1419009 RepID=A0AAV5ANL4_9AGAM|nr:hypothetical protein Clacol_008258 [Clathrus columnatus]
MVYITNWQQFQEAAESLYKKSPVKTRYCVKWRASEGHLVLKITDDNTCIKYKTHSSIFLNRFEALNLNLMKQIQNKRATPVDSPSIQSGVIEGVSTIVSASATLASGITTTNTSSATAGIKKKKPKKKK